MVHETCLFFPSLAALEHRYYGDSFPTVGGDAEGRGGSVDYGDYSHLSSGQAVRDVIAFVRSPDARRRLLGAADGGGAPAGEEAAPWITFGGSYPGMLSAWSRLLHPDAVHAAVASSAPVEARLDFAGYHEKVGTDLGDADVGGSAECVRVVTEGHAEVVAALAALENSAGGEEEDGADRVAGLFDVCGGAATLREDRRNREMFVGKHLSASDAAMPYAGPLFLVKSQH